jgi:hypothetical protein
MSYRKTIKLNYNVDFDKVIVVSKKLFKEIKADGYYLSDALDKGKKLLIISPELGDGMLFLNC